MNCKAVSRSRLVAVVFFAILIFWLVGAGFGVLTAQAFLWDVGSTENVQIGQNESQIIKNVDVKSSEYNITVDVGEMVGAGATLDHNSSSYDILNGQEANESEVLIKDASKQNATIIITNSALDSTDNFDIKLSGMDTTGVSIYNQELSEKDTDLSYTISQDGYTVVSEFDINSSHSVSFADDSYDSTNQSVKLDPIQLDEQNADEIVIWNISSSGKIDQRLGSSTNGSSKIEINSSLIQGETDLGVTIGSDQNQTNYAPIYATDTTTVTIPVTPEVIQNPTYYPDQYFESDSENALINIVFNTNISNNTGNVTLSYRQRPNKTIELRDDEQNHTIIDNKLRIPISQNESISSDTQIEYLTISGLTSTTGGKIDSKIYDPDQVSRVASYEENITVLQGTTVTIGSAHENNTSVHSTTQNTSYNTIEGYNDTTLFKTGNVSTGEYIIKSNSEINGSTLEILDPEQAINIPHEGALNDTALEFQGTTPEHILAINIKNSSGSYNKYHQAQISDPDTASIPLEFPDRGNYTVQVDDMHTGYSTIENISVVDDKSTNLTHISNNTPLSIGQRAQISLKRTYNTTHLKLLRADNQSTAATVELTTPTDDDIPVTFNTYAAGNSSLADDLVTVDANATVESVETSTPNGTLPPDTYTLSVRSEHGSVTTSANATIDLEARSTRDLTTYTTSDLDPAELRSAADVEAAIANGTLSSSTTVTDTETAVYAVEASGLAGAPAVRTTDLDTGADLEAFDGFAFGVRPTTAESDSDSELTTETFSTSDDDAIGTTPADATAHVDDDGLYLVAAGDTALATDDPADGDEFTATFRVDDERLRASAPTDDEHAVTTTLTYAAPDRDASEDHDDSTDDPDRDTTGGTGTGSSGGSDGGPGGGVSERDDSPGTSETPTDRGVGAAGEPAVDVGSTDRLPSRASAEVRAVADLRSAYRDRPDATSNATGTGWRSEADRNGDRAGDASAASETTSSDAGVSGASADRSDSDRATTPDSPGYDNAPIRSTAYDVPGFGPVGALVALVSASLLALRRS